MIDTSSPWAAYNACCPFSKIVIHNLSRRLCSCKRNHYKPVLECCDGKIEEIDTMMHLIKHSFHAGSFVTSDCGDGGGESGFSS